jgi:hypothetical protein
MTKPIPDKAEVALEYPDKLYIGTFEHTSRFDAQLDETGISLSLQRTGAINMRKTIRMHFHYGLFAEILRDLANTASTLSSEQIAHGDALRDAAKALWQALDTGVRETVSKSGKLGYKAAAHAGEADVTKMTPHEEVLLLHVME